MRTEKGCAGYIQNQQRIRTIRTVILFAVVFAVFGTGMFLNNGDRRNIFSIIAAVLCIPAAMSAVSMIMMLIRKPVASSFAESVRKQAGDACVLMELYVTTTDQGLYIHAAVIRDDQMAAYAPDSRSASVFAACSSYIRKALNQVCGPVDVFITGNLEEFQSKVSELASEKTEYPELQDEIAQTLLSLSL